MNIDEDAVNRHARHEAARPKPHDRSPHTDLPVAMDYNANAMAVDIYKNFIPVNSHTEIAPPPVLLDRQKDIPTADDYEVGMHVTATREISPRIPVGTNGIVVGVRADVNMIAVEWYNPSQTKPYAKTNSSPSRGITPREKP